MALHSDTLQLRFSTERGQHPHNGFLAPAQQHPGSQHRHVDIEYVAQVLDEVRQDGPSPERNVKVVRFTERSTVATETSLLQNLFVLLEGTINLVCTNEKRRFVVATLQPGALFGQGALDQPQDSRINAVACDDVTVWIVPASEARGLLIQYPILSWALLRTYAERLGQVGDNLEDVAYRKLPQRLARLLWELADEKSGHIDGYTQQSIADHLGTYRETVSAILRDFKNRGIVELGYRHIRLVDLDTVKEIGGIIEYPL